MQQLNIDVVHERLLKIAEAVNYICENNNIPLYMISGTMLGAVRHKGFIPWDDDMDFAVPYNNYRELITVLNKELPKQYHCITYDNSQSYKIPWIKIEDADTLVIDNTLPLSNDEMPGLTIDIFPLVRCNKEESIFVVRKIQKWIKLKRTIYSLNKNKARNVLKKFIRIAFPLSPNMINDIIMNLTDSIKQGGYYIIPMDPNYSNKFFPIHWFEPLSKYDFENTSFYGAADYDNYLKELYKDYMVLPPEERRRIHCENIFLRNR